MRLKTLKVKCQKFSINKVFSLLLANDFVGIAKPDQHYKV